MAIGIVAKLAYTQQREIDFKGQNIFISWSIRYMYSGNGFKQILSNALDLREETLPVRNHCQLCLSELLEVHHDNLLEVGHPVVLEELHLHLGIGKSFSFKIKGHLNHFRYLLKGVLTLLNPVLPLRDILDCRPHLVKPTTQFHPRPLLSLPVNVGVESFQLEQKLPVKSCDCRLPREESLHSLPKHLLESIKNFRYFSLLTLTAATKER